MLGAVAMAHMVECLLSTHEDLGLSPSTTETRRHGTHLYSSIQEVEQESQKFRVLKASLDYIRSWSCLTIKKISMIMCPQKKIFLNLSSKNTVLRKHPYHRVVFVVVGFGFFFGLGGGGSRVSLCSPGCPQTKICLPLPPKVLGLKVCTTTPAITEIWFPHLER